jgi:hypothetical protein
MKERDRFFILLKNFVVYSFMGWKEEHEALGMGYGRESPDPDSPFHW